MEKLDSLLSAWRSQAVTRLAIGAIRTDVGYQPRAQDAAPARDRARLEDASNSQVGRLRAQLVAYPDSELEPLLVARIDGNTYVIDGHHRLRAYRLASRTAVPVRIVETTVEAAVLASKVANCGGECLPMHPDQYRDAAWQYLAHVTRRGAFPLPKGTTCRSVAARFGGISADTVSRMVRTLPNVTLAEFGDEARDPATGWPRWRHVRGNAWRDCQNALPIELRKVRDAERLAKRLGALMESAAPDVFRMAVEMLLAEDQDAAQDSREALSQWAELDADY